MHVIVAGAGIAGTALAVALARDGAGVTVLEARSRTGDGSRTWLTLAPNGIEALTALDLAGPAVSAGFATPTMQLRDARCRLLATLPEASRDDGLPPVTLTRAALHGVLRDAAVAAGADVRHDQRVGAVEQGLGDDDARVKVRLADGTSLDGDVLVGADGVRSAVRTAIDPRAPAPAYTGVLNTGGLAESAPGAGDPGVVQFAFGSRCFLGWVTAPDGACWWFANPPARQEPGRGELRAVDDDRWRERVVALFADDDLPAAALVASTPSLVRPYPTHDLRRVPTWWRGRAVLAGDAAHAASPSSGQGAAMALEDAVVLARHLRGAVSAGRLAPALAAYERERRTRTERVVARGRRNGSQKAPGPAGRVVRDRLVMPLLAGAARRTKDRGRRPDAWLTDARLPHQGR